MFEQTFKNIDDILHKDAGATSELDYTEQTSWILFLKYLDALEEKKATEAIFENRLYQPIINEPYRWAAWAAPKTVDGKLDHNNAKTGDDLKDFVNLKLFPYLKGFKQRATGPNGHHSNVVEQPTRPYEVQPKPEKILIKLSDGKTRQIQHMMATSFWGADGKPMSAAQFLNSLFGVLPEFFKDEDTLRTLWSNPETRKKLLEGLSEKGFNKEVLAEMQRIIDAENSDLFDVLAHVAFAIPPITRQTRVNEATHKVHQQFEDQQTAFIDFVLSQYITQGVEELSQEKLKGLLELKYQSVHDATKLLGNPNDIRKMFVGFQKYLYQSAMTDTL